jgi:hypothetical protein
MITIFYFLLIVTQLTQYAGCNIVLVNAILSLVLGCMKLNLKLFVHVTGSTDIWRPGDGICLQFLCAIS